MSTIPTTTSSTNNSKLPQRVGPASSKPKDVRVRVAVRVRPFLSHEIARGDENIIQSQDETSLELWNYRYESESLRYTFDACYDDKSTQSAIFHNEIKPLLRGPLQGQNTTCFAFGPTGAGKTHTMQGTEEDPGIIPLAIKELLFLLNADSSRYSYEMTMSYLEIYNEKVYDLLDVKEGDLPIREDQQHNIVIPGLSEVSVHSLEEFNARFATALLNRSSAPTKLNTRSSRSHAVLTIKITRQEKTSPFRKLTGKVNLIDLAGSEDNRKTENQGARLKESGAINMSLFVLGKVVDALNEGQSRIPYRDSKLTRLLQDSLGGDSRACIVANIAPSKHLYFDTYNSLNFASKSRNIVNRPVVHQTINAPPQPIRSAPISLIPTVPAATITSGIAQPPSRLLAGTASSVQSSTSAISVPSRTVSSHESSVLTKSLAVKVVSKEEVVKAKPVTQVPALLPQQDDTLSSCALMTPASKSVMAKSFIDQAKVMVKVDKSKALALYKSALALVPNNARLRDEVTSLELEMAQENVPSHQGKQVANKPSTQPIVKKALFGVAPLSNVSNIVCAQQVKPSPAKHPRSHHADAEDSEEDASPNLRGRGKRARLDDSDFIVHSEDEDASSVSSSPRIAKRSHVDHETRAEFEQTVLPVLNDGDVKTLMRLNGIGKKKAELIIEYRDSHGPFLSLNGLMKVGFAEKGLDKLVLDNMTVTFDDEPKKRKEKAVDTSLSSHPVIQVDSAARLAFEQDTLNILNTGDIKALMNLNGLGKKKAERILEYREGCGSFTSMLELKKIGFAEKGLDKFIKDNLNICFN